jgi:hypothetical protein
MPFTTDLAVLRSMSAHVAALRDQDVSLMLYGGGTLEGKLLGEQPGQGRTITLADANGKAWTVPLAGVVAVAAHQS